MLDASGEVIESFRVRTTKPALRSRLASYRSSRVVLEVGTHSPWISRVVASEGHEAIVANPRRVQLIAENDSKSDGVDAELLARLLRIDPALLKSIVHRGAQAQRDRMLIQSRRTLQSGLLLSGAFRSQGNVGTSMPRTLREESIPSLQPTRHSTF